MCQFVVAGIHSPAILTQCSTIRMVGEDKSRQLKVNFVEKCREKQKNANMIDVHNQLKENDD